MPGSTPAVRLATALALESSACSHGPVGRSAWREIGGDVNLPQAGGYTICSDCG
jgi:hypothetical protein